MVMKVEKALFLDSDCSVLSLVSPERQRTFS